MIYIIIPCFNEGNRLLIQNFHNREGVFYLFVNDGSLDNTYDTLLKLKKNLTHCELLNLKTNLGKANAIREGFLFIHSRLENHDLLAYLDADLSTSIDDLLALKNYTEEYSFVMGSRMDTINKHVKFKKVRHILGRTIALILKPTLKISYYDTQCGAKMIRYDVWNQVFRTKFYTRWFIDIEILKRMDKQKVIEVAVNWSHIDGSKITLMSIPQIIKDLLLLFKHY